MQIRKTIFFQFSSFDQTGISIDQIDQIQSHDPKIVQRFYRSTL